MQKQHQSYKDFDVEDFLLDEQFLDWVREPSEEKNLFWQNFIALHPEKKNSLNRARILANQFHFTADQPEPGSADEVWQNILNNGHSERTKIVSFLPKKVWWAAAVFLLIASGAYFWFIPQSNGIAEKNTPGTFKNDIAPGGDKAILTLADGRKMILDTVANGAIGQQGSVKIMKLNGQLAYSNERKDSREVLYNTITTPRGGQYQLVLADGSKVWLNAASSIRFPTAFIGKERKVEITGEAYFEIAKNTDMPLKIKVNDMEVQVLGTHFNVMAYDDEAVVKTTLVEGKVKVSQAANAVYLMPLQQAVWKRNTQDLSVYKTPDVEKELAWKNGLFHFDDDNIADIMRQLSRWYDVDVDIDYQNEGVHQQYSGIIKRQANISEVLNLLKLAGGVDFTINGKKIMVKAM